MLADDLEHLSDKAIGRPVSHGNATTGAGDAHQFGSGGIRAGCKHSPKHGHDRVESAIRIGHLLSIAFLEVGV
jgi:hypothetical protein